MQIIILSYCTTPTSRPIIVVDSTQQIILICKGYIIINPFRTWTFVHRVPQDPLFDIIQAPTGLANQPAAPQTSSRHRPRDDTYHSHLQSVVWSVHPTDCHPRAGSTTTSWMALGGTRYVYIVILYIHILWYIYQSTAYPNNVQLNL